MQLILYLWLPLDSFVTENDTIDMEEGYERALKYNLALALNALDPQAVLKPYVITEAAESKADIKRMNTPVIELEVDHALVSHTGHYNILTDRYQR